MPTPVTAVALIVAGGRGSRAARVGTGPKQYVQLGDRTVLAHAVAAFAAHPAITRVQVVIHSDDQDAYVASVASIGMSPKLLPPVVGGATRQQSVDRKSVV